MSRTTFDQIAENYERKLKEVKQFKFVMTGRLPAEAFEEQYADSFEKYEIIAYSRVSFIAAEFEKYLYNRFKKMENFVKENSSDDKKEPNKPEKYVVFVVFNE